MVKSLKKCKVGAVITTVILVVLAGFFLYRASVADTSNANAYRGAAFVSNVPDEEEAVKAFGFISNRYI